ncbi:MAG TPA: type II secretion system GspH family protein [Sporosarcina psychrophila]|uniref:Type II secretion system GspH family protein n=1 Tax=Sporosarcina psychrophila TaxID=1476 RepID=A0A921KDM1_SPOPS|nr:type II secretion system GspH family protein [Sporosarcina psychrophila]
MKKFLQKRLNNEKGLTLVELLAVIVILGIIAAIAVPSIGGIIDNSRVKAIKADAQNILSAGNLYFVENSDKTVVTLDELKTGKFIDDAGSFNGATDVNIKKVAGGNTFTGTGKNGKKQLVITDKSMTAITAIDNSTTTDVAP